MKTNNPITQEPMESEIDFQIMMVLHNTNHKVNPYGDSTVSQLRTLFSKWLKQEREKTLWEAKMWIMPKLIDIRQFPNAYDTDMTVIERVMHVVETSFRLLIEKEHKQT